MKKIEIIISALIIAVLGVWAGMDTESHINGHARFNGNYSTSNQKACFDVIRTINGAVENYNMDVRTEEMIRSFNNDVKEMLIKKNYLSPKINPPTERCEYLSDGDLAEGGVIYCNFHGDLENKLKLWDRSRAKADAKKHSNWFLVGLGIFIAVYLLLSGLSWLWKSLSDHD